MSATSLNLSKVCHISEIRRVISEQPIPNTSYDNLDKTSSNTLKRNPKMELSKSDLLKLLTYLEGELQARDIVIATLKCEKIKYMLKHKHFLTCSMGDPFAALHRDNFAMSSRANEPEPSLADQQLNSLEMLVSQQRQSQLYMTKLLHDIEIRHQKVIDEVQKKLELYENVCPNFTSPGNLNLSQTDNPESIDADNSSAAAPKTNACCAALAEDLARHKQIVLLLLSERKKIFTRYVEERKRSEDLAQILSEEKSRIDNMAEGLEEESKKSLKMEAELEKQINQFDSESQILKSNLEREEQRAKDLEEEVKKVRMDYITLEKQLKESQESLRVVSESAYHQDSHGATYSWPKCPSPLPPQRIHPTEPADRKDLLTKIVQPTAVISSVPVSAPTTGVAQDITANHAMKPSTAFAPSQFLHSNKNSPVKAEEGAFDPNSALPKQKMPLPAPSPVNKIGTEKKMPIGRGTPPPVPPNKPVLLPKKDSAMGKKVEPLYPVAIDLSKFRKDT